MCREAQPINAIGADTPPAARVKSGPPVSSSSPAPLDGIEFCYMSEHKDRIYHLKGNPFEIGYTMGQSLGSKLETNIQSYTRERVPHGATLNAERWRSDALPWLRSLPARFQEEFEGLAQGAKLPLQQLAEWAYLEVILSGRCSGAIITIDHQAWIARGRGSPS